MKFNKISKTFTLFLDIVDPCIDLSEVEPLLMRNYTVNINFAKLLTGMRTDDFRRKMESKSVGFLLLLRSWAEIFQAQPLSSAFEHLSDIKATSDFTNLSLQSRFIKQSNQIALSGIK
jgi:hypothetical protein